VALTQAIAVAAHTGAALELLWVEDRIPTHTSMHGTVHGSVIEELERVLAELHDESAAKLGDLARQAREQNVAVSHHVARGHADEEIVERAEEQGADLVVVGTRGLTGIKRFFLGSVAENVVRASHTNVLVARGQVADFARVLVATDFSPASERAVDLACTLAAPDAELVLFHAWQFPPGTVGLRATTPKDGDAVGELQEKILELNARRGQALCQRVTRTGRSARFVQEHGAPAAEIQAQLEAAPYDLACLSTHGHRGFRRLLLGSVTEATVRHAPCSVLVVHAGSVPAPEAVAVSALTPEPDTGLPQPA
ncbi:MAG TPA: universal stress protein, partial [Haliangium sp.]|nr:universal stress protein [Haliangium sp.]